ncbi:unnamed protein product [Rotaria socialis]
MRIIQKLCSIRLVDQLYVDINLESNKDDEVNHSVHSLTIPDEHFQSLQCCYHRRTKAKVMNIVHKIMDLFIVVNNLNINKPNMLIR